MRFPDPPYRKVIDELVRSCEAGQGQIAARRARAGVWNANASADLLPEQHALNVFLTSLTGDQREVLAALLAETFVGGVHETLVVLHQEQVPPFEDGYEGTPFHDFIGRLTGWDWPSDD